MAFPNWLSIIFSILTVVSFYPQLQCLWLGKNSSGISVYYVLFNLIVATEQLTIVFFFLVNNNVGSAIFVHQPHAIGDWLNLGQMTVSYILFLVLFALTLHYLPNDGFAHKSTAVAIYIAFLFISVIPAMLDVVTGGPHYNGPYRQWPVVLFGVPHILFINPVATVLIVVSFIIQVRQTLDGSSSSLSVRGLAVQSLVFALLGVSWLLRVRWPPANMPTFYNSPIMNNYLLVGWAAVDHILFALGQAVLCFIICRRNITAAQRPVGETEPLLAGH